MSFVRDFLEIMHVLPWKESAHVVCLVVSDKGVVVLGGNAYVIAFARNVTSDKLLLGCQML